MTKQLKIKIWKAIHGKKKMTNEYHGLEQGSMY